MDYINEQDESYNLGFRDGEMDGHLNGWEECKRKVLEILNKPLANLDLSTDHCDSRYIEKIRDLDL